MNLAEFCKGIRLDLEGIAIINAYQETDQVFESLQEEFWKDRGNCYQKILKMQEPEKYFLYFFSKTACTVWEEYQKQGISEKVFFDTFYDLTIWCRNSKRRFGNYGIREQGWLWRHLEMTIFRLGRLQFEKMKSEWEVNLETVHIKKGEPVISIHIPEGGAMDIEECRKSFLLAKEFWGNDLSYVCHSWLLGPELSMFLGEETNIIRFQKFFEIVAVDYEIPEGEERIFGRLQENPENYEETTRLQKKAKEYLMQGGKLGGGLGILKENFV